MFLHFCAAPVQDLFILRSAASRADIQATALHLRRSPRALQKRLRRLLLSVPCRVQPGTASKTWEASARVTEAVAAARAATHSDLPLNLRASLLEILVPTAPAVAPAEGSGAGGNGCEHSPEGKAGSDNQGPVLEEEQQRQPAAGDGFIAALSGAKKRRHKRQATADAEGTAEASRQPGAKRKRMGATRRACKGPVSSPLASALASLLNAHQPGSGGEASPAPPLPTTLGPAPRTGGALALAAPLPHPLDQCSTEQLQSLMQEAGLTAEQVAGITTAVKDGEGTVGQRLAAVAGSFVQAWEVRRVLACTALPSTTLRHLTLLRLLPVGVNGCTQEAVRAAHRQLALVLHPDKQPDSAVVNSNVTSTMPSAMPVPDMTAAQVRDAWCGLQEARDALFNLIASSC